MKKISVSVLSVMAVIASGCGDDKNNDGEQGNQGPDPGGSIDPPAASCDAAGDSQVTATPELGPEVGVAVLRSET